MPRSQLPYRTTYNPLNLAAIAIAAALFMPALGMAESPKTQFRQEELFQVNGMSSPPNLVFGMESKPWLAEVVRNLRQTERPWMKPIKVAIVRDDGDETFLIVEWYGKRDFDRWDYLSLYKVSADAVGVQRVRHLRTLSAGSRGSATIVDPSGYPLAPGEAPIISVLLDGDGVAPGTESYRFILMEGNSLDITPKWVGDIGLPKDFDGDGRLEFPVNMSRYEYYSPESEDFSWRDAPAVLDWRNQNLRPACKNFESVFRSYIAWNESWIERYPADPGWRDKPLNEMDAMGYRMEHVANLALAFAQIGDHERAIAYGLKFASAYENPKHPILKVLKKARELDHLQCPVSAALSNDPRWRPSWNAAKLGAAEPWWAGEDSSPRDSNSDGAIDVPIDQRSEVEYLVGCQRCIPVAPAILTWKKNTFVPACKHLADTFQGDIDSLENFLANFPTPSAWKTKHPDIGNVDRSWLAKLAKLAVIRSQIGQHAKAATIAERFQRERRRFAADDTLLRSSSPLSGLLKKAKELDHLQCPFSAALKSDPRWRDQ